MKFRPSAGGSASGIVPAPVAPEPRGSCLPGALVLQASHTCHRALSRIPPVFQRAHAGDNKRTEVPDGFAFGAGPSDALVLTNALPASVPDLVVLAERLSTAVSASVSDLVVLADAATFAFFALALAAVVNAEPDAATLPARAPHAVVRAYARSFAVFAVPLVPFVRAQPGSVALAAEFLVLAVHALGRKVPARGHQRGVRARGRRHGSHGSSVGSSSGRCSRSQDAGAGARCGPATRRFELTCRSSSSCRAPSWGPLP